MPNQDKTGPEGKGEKTGRGDGLCSDTRKELSEAADFPANLGLENGKGRKNRRGRGDGKGRGSGRGRRSTD